MPQAQVIDLGPDVYKRERNIGGFFSELSDAMKNRQDRSTIDNILQEYEQNRQDAQALPKLFMDLERSNVAPTKRLELQQRLMDQEKLIIERDKALNSQFKKGMVDVQDRERQKQNLIKAGWPEYAAELYLDAPPGVKNTMEREHAELTGRGFRKPLEEVKTQATTNPTQAASTESEELPIEAFEDNVAQAEIAADPNAWPEIPKPPEMNNAERIKWENNNEKVNTKELQESQKKKKAYQTNDLLINSMQKTSKFLPSGIKKMIVIDPETGDVRPTAQLAGQINPETELYIKNLKQFLKGAKDFFGARVTNFDVNAFMAQLPGLITSQRGRDLILRQMKYVNELESTYNNTLNDGIKQYGRNASLIDIMKATDEKVKVREPELLNRVNNVVEASKFSNMMDQNPDKYRGTILMGKGGRFKAVLPQDVEKAKTSGWEAY